MSSRRFIPSLFFSLLFLICCSAMKEIVFFSPFRKVRASRVPKPPERTRPCRERKRRYITRLASVYAYYDTFYPFCSPFSPCIDEAPRTGLGRISHTVRYPSSQKVHHNLRQRLSLFSARASFNRDKLLARPSTLSPRRASASSVLIFAYTVELILDRNTRVIQGVL